MMWPEQMTEWTTATSMRLIARTLAAGRLKTITSGAECIPASGPALILVRHYHHLFDGLALFAALPRPFHIVVALDWVKSPAMRLFMTRLTQMARWPVILRRELFSRGEVEQGQRNTLFSLADAARYQRRALRDSVRILAESRLLVIFPEGYPNIDPIYTPKTHNRQFLPFRSGFVAIARAAERRLGRPVPIIAAGIHYAAGKPWLASVNFAGPVTRESFASGDELIRYCEETVKRLSIDVGLKT